MLGNKLFKFIRQSGRMSKRMYFTRVTIFHCNKSVERTSATSPQPALEHIPHTESKNGKNPQKSTYNVNSKQSMEQTSKSIKATQADSTRIAHSRSKVSLGQFK
jgi:hypothetical protein